ncbi:MAG: hypothetical protein LC632_01580 [Xanthomonadaceae bacterium]|nr:hypothetical protein [Xanthomonadaceae bacterium]
MGTHTGKYTGRVAHQRPAGISEVRARLTGLQLNPRLAPFVRAEITEADKAIQRAEQEPPSTPEAHELVAEARLKVERTVETARLRYTSALSVSRRPDGSH